MGMLVRQQTPAIIADAVSYNLATLGSTAADERTQSPLRPELRKRSLHHVCDAHVLDSNQVKEHVVGEAELALQPGGLAEQKQGHRYRHGHKRFTLLGCQAYRYGTTPSVSFAVA